MNLTLSSWNIVLEIRSELLAICLSQNSTAQLLGDWKLQSLWLFSRTPFYTIFFFFFFVKFTLSLQGHFSFFLSNVKWGKLFSATQRWKFAVCHYSVPCLEKGETTCLLLRTATSVAPEFFHFCLNIWNTIHVTVHFKSLCLYSCTIILQVNCLFFLFLGGGWFINRC